MNRTKLLYRLLLLCTITLFPLANAQAHKVRIFAWQEGNIVHTESKFSGGKAARGATVLVIEKESEKELHQGNTNDQGLYSFPLPSTSASQLKIIVDSGDGHKNSWIHRLTPEESITKSNEVATVLPVSEHKHKHDLTPNIDEDELTRILDELLEAKLAPIRRSLAETQEEGPSLQDILGGIGYLLGLAGIAAYVKSRQNKE